MHTQDEAGDQLFLKAENLAKDFSLFPESEAKASIDAHVDGMLPQRSIERELRRLRPMDIDTYVEQCVAPAEDPARANAKDVMQQLGGRLDEVIDDGPFYAGVLTLEFAQEARKVGVIAQNRGARNGVWMPEHHLAAARSVAEWAKRKIPIVSLMDTPGADGEAEANRDNQAHAISRLIAEMDNVDVPTLGIIFGLGYSGGAIPLAASNFVFSLRDGVFNTIQPKGLANIARKYGLSWQECAKRVGVSAVELYDQGNIDGIIDYVPGEAAKLDNLRRAIVTGIESIEQGVCDFVAENPYIIEHYRRNLERYLQPSAWLHAIEATGSLSMSKNPTEYSNVFGVAYRYLRYLGLRKRIRSTTTTQYGRLADVEVPRGELADRSERERRKAFLGWLQDPEKIVYDETLSRAWKNYAEKKEALNEERSRLGRLIFGEPRKNYDDAQATLLVNVATYLYNRWKSEAPGNFHALLEHLARPDVTRVLLRAGEIEAPRDFAAFLRSDESPLSAYIRRQFSHDGRKLLAREGLADKSDGWVRQQLSAELNLLLEQHVFAADPEIRAALQNGEDHAPDAHVGSATAVRDNRALLEHQYEHFLAHRDPGGALPPLAEITLVDVLLQEELRERFRTECLHLLVFDSVYDQVINQLDTIAEEADQHRALSRKTTRALLERCLANAMPGLSLAALELDELPREAALERLRELLFDWLDRLHAHTRGETFLKSVEEWKKGVFPHLSDTLFVVVTYLFERLIPNYAHAEREDKRFDGKINPRNIGRRKDFWNRLTIAYRDLLIETVLRSTKRQGSTSSQAFIEEFFDDFKELYADRLSSDPVQFPGFRVAIESALASGKTPCGMVTGLGEFRGRSGNIPCGIAVSNVEFQAGAFDMASAEKFCHLLVDCAQRRLPVICFISSGGMQTKEGAAALFSMAAVNDRITRFVRDNDLPVIVFGYGDCTGGAQASFVTHPLVQTYYLSGTNMPFAGQIVVPSHLPSSSTLANYLSLREDSMQGLVRHPFAHNLDDDLRRIDPDIPLANEDVRDVVERVVAGVITSSQPSVPRTTVQPQTYAALARPVQRVLVHARGCTAVKLIRVARRIGKEVVLVQSDPDMESAAVDALGPRDRLVCIGGNTPDESYLNGLSVVRVAEHERADALHPGIGFLSENSQFAELCRSHGINFIGPPVDAMETMGNKSNAINTAMRNDVPVVPGSHGILTHVERASEMADRIGFPVLIKAVHGGGGKGIQVVERQEDFHDLFRQVAAEARNAFGNGDVYLEKYVASLRHIEAQLLRDTHGHTRVLGLRDCTVQRNNQKIIEESGSPALSAALAERVCEYTAALADAVGYVGAGTVEFIYDRAAGEVYFMEMNTRLQIEHPVTEQVSGVDIVAEQFRIASGESIADLTVGTEGVAIEVRVNAERPVLTNDGTLRFRPDPGTIGVCELPQADGIDVISAAAPDKVVSPFYDSMIAQLIAHGPDRNAAIERLLAYLESVRIEGVCTNLALLERILRDPTFRAGDYDTAYLDGFLGLLDPEELIEETRAAAGVAGSVLDEEDLRIEGSDELKVLSPSTGIFYITPSPSEPEYVSVGDEVAVDDTLCQLEAMKMFSPLALMSFNYAEQQPYPRESRYTITRINIANGQQVNAGDLLFIVRPIAMESAA